MGSCVVCHDDTTAEDRICAECAAWEDYWFSLTPEEQAREIERMDSYQGEGV